VIPERLELQDLLVQLEFKVRKVKLETKEIPVPKVRSDLLAQLVQPEQLVLLVTQVQLDFRVQ
tara:strand:- start:1038 stop:1226 length:189 start_codon:yes stop_codon:yes gene_type:complete